jgi:allophanate hydrolase
VPRLSTILSDHLSGARRPSQTIAACYAAIRAHDDSAIFIAVLPEDEAMAQALRLEQEGPRGRALWGVPVAVKDNIDDANFPTTAACPAYAYRPERDSTVVARLKAAGAIIIGKTNLDQFATGLVGVRSPYGVPRNALRPDLVPGGSSSGSASAVAAGIVPVALGTDTAGSGRVPAGLQNIVGLKPSLGLVSTAGVVPACRTLDCVSIFALDIDDAFHALQAIAGPDEADAFSRSLRLGSLGAVAPGTRIGVPREQDLDFGGDDAARAAFAAAVARMNALGFTTTEIDYTPFLETAKLLYEGPWVTERWLVVRDLLKRDPHAIHPVTRAIVETGAARTADEFFVARYKLADLARAARLALEGIDILMTPTAPRPVTLAEIEADPIGANSMLGRYTNSVNLLDMAALAIPSTLERDGLARGVTLIGPSGSDALLASLGRLMHRAADLPLGATGERLPTYEPAAAPPVGTVEIAVVGAHLSGMALNHELRDAGATFVRSARTSADYRLYALAGGPPARPGLLRVAQDAGAPIAIEIWAMPPEGFGRFVSRIPAPLGIGTLRLEDGSRAQGFLAEAQGVEGATDITGFGGWRAYQASPETVR